MKPATILSMILSIVFLSMAGAFLWYGILDARPPLRIISAVISKTDPTLEFMEVTVTAQRDRYCHGQRFGFLHDRYSFGIDPVELPPEGFRGPIRSDGLVKFTFRVDVKDYFWQDKDGFTYRAEWRYRCNPLQGSLFPEIIVSSPDLVIPHS